MHLQPSDLKKEPKTCDGEKIASSTNVAGKKGYPHVDRRLKLDPCLLPCTKISTKWIKDFCIRPETLKHLQKVVGNTHEHTGIGNNFLSRTKGSACKRKNKLDCIQLKTFCTAKETVTSLKRKWEEMFVSYSSD
jgi:hypothetical protein